MADQDRAPGSGARPRPRKPTPAERRDQRALVDDPNEILEAAARFLEARPRSVAEVRRKLTRLGYQQELVGGAVERLTELGYLDDDAFARSWVESRDRARPRGEHALKRELELKGVDRTLIDAVLEDRRERATVAGTGGDGLDDAPINPDESAAERLLRKKLPALLRETDPRKRRQRAYGLLARNGFSPDVCSAVTRRVLDEDMSDDDGGAGEP